MKSHKKGLYPHQQLTEQQQNKSRHTHLHSRTPPLINEQSFAGFRQLKQQQKPTPHRMTQTAICYCRAYCTEEIQEEKEEERQEREGRAGGGGQEKKRKSASFTVTTQRREEE